MCCQSSLRETQVTAALRPAGMRDSNTTLAAPFDSAARQALQSPAARWFAEPSSFALVDSGEDHCSWQPMSSCDLSEPCIRGSTKDEGCLREPGPSFVMVPVAANLSFGAWPVVAQAMDAPYPPTCSAVPPASAFTSASPPSGTDVDCDVVDQSRVKLSASASRRRRRQKAAAYAAAAAAEQGDKEEDGAFAFTLSAALGADKAQASRVQPSFGQRRCAELSAQLTSGGEDLTCAVEEIRGSIRRLSFDGHGCRLVQDALELAEHRNAASLAEELQGHVRAAIASPHGNYVVQKIIEVLPMPLAEFVADELRFHAAETARHRYGCRVLCRLVEHSGGCQATAAIIDEVLAAAGDLCMHAYGHYVVESVLEHGNPAQRDVIARILSQDLPRYTRDRNSTYVLKAVLAQCPNEYAHAVADALVGNASELLKLADDQYGHHIVRALVRLPAHSHVVRATLERSVLSLQQSPYGCRVLEDLAQEQHTEE